jgi:hypothetical protein
MGFILFSHTLIDAFLSPLRMTECSDKSQDEQWGFFWFSLGITNQLTSAGPFRAESVAGLTQG